MSSERWFSDRKCLVDAREWPGYTWARLQSSNDPELDKDKIASWVDRKNKLQDCDTLSENLMVKIKGKKKRPMENEIEYFTTETSKYLFKEKKPSAVMMCILMSKMLNATSEILPQEQLTVPAGCDESTINTITCVKLNLKIIYPNFSKD